MQALVWRFRVKIGAFIQRNAAQISLQLTSSTATAHRQSFRNHSLGLFRTSSSALELTSPPHAAPNDARSVLRSPQKDLLATVWMAREGFSAAMSSVCASVLRVTATDKCVCALCLRGIDERSSMCAPGAYTYSCKSARKTSETREREQYHRKQPEYNTEIYLFVLELGQPRQVGGEG